METKTESYGIIDRETKEYEAVVWDYEERVAEVAEYLREEAEGVKRINPLSGGHGLAVYFSRDGNGDYKRFRFSKEAKRRITEIMGYPPEVGDVHNGYAQRGRETRVSVYLSGRQGKTPEIGKGKT